MDESADYFTNNPAQRKDMQLQLAALSNTDAYAISSLLQDTPLRKPPWFNLTLVGMAMAVVFTVLSFFYPVFLILLIFPASINMLIHYWNKENIFLYILSFPQLNILINVCRKISTKHVRFADAAVERSLLNLKSFQQRIGFLTFSNDHGIKGELNQLAGYAMELLKAVFLIEVFTLFYMIDEVESQKESVAFLFNYVGEIDIAISIASLRAGNLKTCKPSIIPAEKKLSARNIYHPLIADGVKNDLVVDSKSVLITGSNMSGKTTFLRTLLLNNVLAQTIYTCFADELETPVMRQFSSMRIDDNLQEGKSYYFEEVNVMGDFVRNSTSHQNIFVLDEVFKGTNTVERIAAAKAILSYLNRGNNIVLVSTHDVELSHMLENEYALYHFSETVENNTLQFDYKLKEGRLKTRNAIRILEIVNYPPEIVNEARAISNALDQHQRSLQIRKDNAAI